MKGKLKYAVTVIILIACTVGIMVFPSAYYNSVDAAMENNVHINSLGISVKNEPLSCQEVNNLLISKNTTQMTLSGNNVTDKEILQLSKTALNGLIADCDKDSAFYFMFNYFLERLDYCFPGYSMAIFFGEIDGSAASVTIADIILEYYGEDYTEFYYANEKSNSISLYLKVDFNTSQIYQIGIIGMDIISAEYESYYKSLDEKGISEKRIAEIDSLNGIEAINDYIASYWDIPNNLAGIDWTDDGSVNFVIESENYYDYGIEVENPDEEFYDG